MVHPALSALAAFACAVPAFSLQTEGEAPAERDAPAPISAEDVHAAARLVGLSFTDDEVALMLPDLTERLGTFVELRADPLPNDLAPALLFTPWIPGLQPAPEQAVPPLPALPPPTRPDDLFFRSIPELAALVRAREVSCVALTEAYLARLDALDEHLHCVIHFTRERALAQAQERDADLEQGLWRGPLHGIPWGVKDLMAVAGTPTTWGAKPFEDQTLDATAAVVERLDEAGAVLIAKLSVGALAWGDVWYGERTRSPWDTRRGSSGSSAGSASATAAGGVVFALGTETLGSIVSPSVVCGTSALRPTFGRVPRTGTMALCWSMDKVGPITRTLDDAAYVFAAIQGRDGRDAFSRDGRVAVAVTERADLAGVRVGVFDGAFAGAEGVRGVVGELEALGATVVEIEPPVGSAPLDAILLTLGAEAATAFDELTRSGADDLMVRQVRQAWPNVFRAARSLPAVEYLRAQRLRTRLMLDLDVALAKVDVIVHAPYAGGILSATNLTGHPTVVAPYARPAEEDSGRPTRAPRSVCFTGQLDQDEALVAIAGRWQRAHPEHVAVPPLAFLGGK